MVQKASKPASSVLRDPMPDRPEDPPAESPMQRALRMRRAAMAAKAKVSGGAAFNPRQASKMAAGASKPWMKK